MAGTFKKIYVVSEPVPLPRFVRVDFMWGGDIVSSLIQLVSVYGDNEFLFHTSDDSITLAGMTTALYFQDGDSWNSALYKRVAPYAFNFPFCFSGLKIGWR